MFFEKVAVIGVGLLGASFALAMREKGLCKTIRGFGRKAENLKAAKELGIIDDYSSEIKSVCEGADLILLATPVESFKDLVCSACTAFGRGTIVTDVGSVKGGLVYELEELISGRGYYIGSHPIAGSDKSGIDNARADLFLGARCIVTPTVNSNREALKKVTDLWEALGAKTELMDPMIHDEIYAAVSHLPHLIAYALVNSVDDLNKDFMVYGGPGFRDATRIALSSPEMWRDISISNKENLIKLIDIFRKNLETMKDMLIEDDAEGIEKEFAKARASRTRLE